VQRVNETMQASQASQQIEPAEPAEPAEQQPAPQPPINITVPVTVVERGSVSKQGRAVRQQDGSYMMESIETPVE